MLGRQLGGVAEQVARGPVGVGAPCASSIRAYSYSVWASHVRAPIWRFSSSARSKCSSARSHSPIVAASIPRYRSAAP